MALEERFDIAEVRNPYDMPFKARWDGQEYIVPAKGRLMLPYFLALHIANKLTDYAIQKEKDVTKLYDQDTRKEYLQRYTEGIVIKKLVSDKSESELFKAEVERLQNQLSEGFIASSSENKENLEESTKENEEQMTYLELQNKAKELGIPANQSKDALIEAIKNHGK